MIAYFSGTGNSRHIARQLSRRLGEETVVIPDAEAGKLSFSGETFGIVCPVYSWGIPPVVKEWIGGLHRGFAKSIKEREAYVWVALTCGDDTGMAPRIMRNKLSDAGIELDAIWSVQMPNVYVLLPGFDVDPSDVEDKKLLAAEQRVAEIAELIKRRTETEDVVYGSFPRLKTAVVFPLFRHFGINTRKWRCGDSCEGCGQCMHLCPMHNISIENGRPQWGRNCASCLACYHGCPTHAITYGKATEGKGHYRRFIYAWKES